jgi:hypothetical protein
MNNLMILMGSHSHGLWDLSELSSSYADTAAGTQTYGVDLTIRTDRTIDVLRTVAADLLDEQAKYTENVSDCYVRLAYVSGDALMAGPTLNTWHACTTERSWLYEYTSSGGVDLKAGTYALSLASDSGGTDIQAGPINITFTVGETG